MSSNLMMRGRYTVESADIHLTVIQRKRVMEMFIGDFINDLFLWIAVHTAVIVITLTLWAAVWFLIGRWSTRLKSRHLCSHVCTHNSARWIPPARPVDS